MKQLLLILFILISFNVCYSSEINKNICPVADLQDDILKSFFIEKKKETYKDVFSGENVTEFKY